MKITDPTTYGHKNIKLNKKWKPRLKANHENLANQGQYQEFSVKFLITEKLNAFSWSSRASQIMLAV